MAQIYDTRTRTKVPFETVVDGAVSIYFCGPTVYDHAHLGHARSALTYDVIRRYLLWRGYEVKVVSNVTDIDDQIIARAAEAGVTETEIAARFEQAYIDVMDRLAIMRPTQRPHATAYVDEMIELIGQMVDSGAAYVVEGKGIYYAIDSDPSYGELVGRSNEELLEAAGSRVEVDTDKRSPLDFALWKSAKEGEPTWDTPWGAGRPGWHTECVAMASGIFGHAFDIHGGGDDLVFPHHQNELTQANACGNDFARYWVHNAMVNIDGEKMSKSLGNFTTLYEALDEMDPRSMRLLVLQTHYRRTMEMTDDALAAAAEGMRRMDTFLRRAWQPATATSSSTG